MPQRFAEYTKVTDKRLGTIEQKLDTLTGRVGTGTDEVHTLTDRVDTLRGYGLEAKLTTKIPPLVSREFDVWRVYPIWLPGITPDNPRTQAFENAIEQAAENGDDTDFLRVMSTPSR